MTNLLYRMAAIVLLGFAPCALAGPAQAVQIVTDTPTATYRPPGSDIRFVQIARSLLLPQKDGTQQGLGGQTYSITWGDANNNQYPDLYLNHHTAHSSDRPEEPNSHILFDLGAPGGGTAYTELGGIDQHTAIFVDINGDGQQDILELSGANRGQASTASEGNANQVFIGDHGHFTDNNVAQYYNLDYPLGRGRQPIPLNINNTLGLLLTNAPRADGQYPSALFERQASGSFAVQPDEFRAARCTEAPRLAQDCTWEQPANLLYVTLAISGYFNPDDLLDMVLLSKRPSTEAPVTLFTGNKDGKFKASRFAGPKIYTHDAAVLDANNDGKFELWLQGKARGSGGGPAGNRLFAFDSDGRFVAQPTLEGALDQPRRSMSVVTGDFDNDRDEDAVTYDVAADNTFHFSIWENDGTGDFRRTQFNDQGNPGFARNVAVADYNLDGALDLLFADGNGSPQRVKGVGGYTLLQGVPNHNHWLEIDLRDPWHLRGLGARVFVTAGGVTMLRGQFGGVHQATQNDTRLHFGLGNASTADIRVQWSDGASTTLAQVAVDNILRIDYPQKK